MPAIRMKKLGAPQSLTRTEKKAAEIDSAVKKELETVRAADLKKIARLKALRLKAGSGEAPLAPDGEA